MKRPSLQAWPADSNLVHRKAALPWVGQPHTSKAQPDRRPHSPGGTEHPHPVWTRSQDPPASEGS